MSRALVTGASGFVGRALTSTLINRGFNVRTARRRLSSSLDSRAEQIEIDDLLGRQNWVPALTGVEVVFHLAARAHQIQEKSSELESTYRRINCDATLELARAAATLGCRRFVFLSSVKVNGECTAERPFSPSDVPLPLDVYGRSKHAAEQGLWEISRLTGLEVVVVRAPLVYGPGVRANFLRLMKIVDQGVPLPFALLKNQRSLVYLGNLVDALCLAATHKGAEGRTYLVSDGEDVSTPDLVRKIATALGRTPKILPCPRWLLSLTGFAIGNPALISRLTDSLQVDSGAIRGELGWRPPYSLSDGLRETAKWYLALTR